MQKKWFKLICLLFVFILAACGSDDLSENVSEQIAGEPTKMAPEGVEEAPADIEEAVEVVKEVIVEVEVEKEVEIIVATKALPTGVTVATSELNERFDSQRSETVAEVTPDAPRVNKSAEETRNDTITDSQTTLTVEMRNVTNNHVTPAGPTPTVLQPTEQMPTEPPTLAPTNPPTSTVVPPTQTMIPPTQVVEQPVPSGAALNAVAQTMEQVDAVQDLLETVETLMQGVWRVLRLDF